MIEYSRHIRSRTVVERRGSTLVMVMVVMLVVGLIATQTSQLLVAFYSSDRQQRIHDQARELVELGIVRARESLLRDRSYRGEAFKVEVWDSSRRDGDFLATQTGEIQIEVVESDAAKATIRIAAKYPVGEPSEIVSKWESEKW